MLKRFRKSPPPRRITPCIPKYCGTCGNSLQYMTKVARYDICTGERVLDEYLVCKGHVNYKKYEGGEWRLPIFGPSWGEYD